MTKLISAPLIKNLGTISKPTDIRDSRVKGFILRVQPSGVMTYYVEYGRGKRKKIGPASVFKPDEARTEARKILASVHKGEDLKANELRQSVESLETFIDQIYEPWVSTHLRQGKVTCGRIKRNFEKFLNLPLTEFTAHKLEKWRSKRLDGGSKPATVNRDLNDLRAAFSRAVSWGYLDEHPLRSVKPLRTDGNFRCRFLDDSEMKHLKEALDAREEQIRVDRRSGNEWRKKRDRKLLPNLDEITFVDHLKPMVMISLNTGMRRGELFTIKWENIDFKNSNLTVVGGISKSGRTRHIPLNSEVQNILQEWKLQTKGTRGLVFKSMRGRKFDNVGSSWARILKKADIESFRWHDMRHTFASRLVMAGVDLNTVRELLGHSDYNMTLRYAHLAPAHKAAAVEKLALKW